MKNIKSFNMFNESLRDKLKGKSDKELDDMIKSIDTKTSDFIKLEKGCQYGVLLLVKQALKGDVYKHDIEYGLIIASYHGQLDIIKYLLDNTDIHPGVYGSESLLSAMENDKLDVVKYLLDDGRCDPSVENNLTLRNALKWNHFNVVKMLLKDERVMNKLNNNVSLKKTKEQVDQLNLNESLRDKL